MRRSQRIISVDQVNSTMQLMQSVLGMWLVLSLVGSAHFSTLEVRGQSVARTEVQTLNVGLQKSRGNQDGRTSLRFTVTSGAAPGYVEDRACATCHPKLYRSYQDVGMAQSFFRPRSDKVIEDFKNNSFFHEASQSYYEMIRHNDRLFFKRYQLDEEQKEINIFEEEVDWIVGSGHRSRVYLYQTEVGELFQLPLAWYTQSNSWAMAPGFDRRSHQGVSRQVRRQCMFCHNAYPNVARGSDAYGAPQVFPAVLPEGTGCQRCHGPGAEHVRLALRQANTPEQIRTTIVNPGRLSPKLREDVCYQCHMQPAVVLFGVRRFGRHDYSFRPGESLDDYLMQVDVIEEGKEPSERFEINHHPYRLEQSRCYQESQGRLNCLTCHDPHRKVPQAERVAHYQAACLSCHQSEECRLSSPDSKHLVVSSDRENHQQEGGSPLAGSEETKTADTQSEIDPDDCILCHMPQRRTQDVVQVIMTDHFIRRRPVGSAFVEPLEESEPIIKDVKFLDPKLAPTGALAEVYRTVAAVRAEISSAAAVDQLQEMLDVVQPAEVEPYLDLARGQLRYRRFAAAERTLIPILKHVPSHPLGREWLGIALAGLDRIEEAVKVMLGGLEQDPSRAQLHLNLGRILLRRGQTKESIRHLRQAVKARPNLVAAWFHLGNGSTQLGDMDKAIEAYQRALKIDPSHDGAYLAIGQIFLEKGDQANALRYWRHWQKVAKRPEPIAKLIAETLSSSTESP